MRRTALAVAVTAAVFLLSIAIVEACGDKVLRIGRGVRFQRTSHPVAVLIYIPSNAKRASDLQSLLKKVGHSAYTVQDVDSLRSALMSGRYDLVFTDLAEAAGLEKQVETSASKPVVVPVVSKASKERKAEVAAAQKQYRCIVKDPTVGDYYLDAIEEALRSKVHLLVKKPQKT